MARTVDFYLISNPEANDPGGALKAEAAAGGHDRIVSNVVDLVTGIVREVTKRKAKIGTLTLSTHGTAYGFRVGGDFITNDSPLLPIFAVLAPHFTSGSLVKISACKTGQNHSGVLNQLSRLLGGVPVIAFKEDVTYVDGPWIFKGNFTSFSEPVVCLRNKCLEF